MSGSKIWVTAGLALAINGGSLLGMGFGSVGGVARSIECRHEIAHAIENARSVKWAVDAPPFKVGREMS